MSEISINLPKTDYHGGETIEGTVKLVVDQAVPARGVRLSLRGFETSLWSSGSGRVMATHAEEHVWFDDEQTLFGQSKQEMGSLLKDVVKGVFSCKHYPVIEPGTYEYPFSFALPDPLPGDYESSRGDVAIRYVLKAYVDIPLRVDIEAEQRLTIYQPADEAAKPGGASNSKCFPLHPDEDLRVEVTLDKGAYKLGDTVRATVEIENKTKKPIQGATVGLLQVESITTDSGTTERSSLIHPQHAGDCTVEPGENVTHEIEYRIEPHLYPSIVSAKMVHVSYRLSVSLDVRHGRDLDVEAPILLYEEPGKPGGVDA